jgi:hypothetical protein
MKIFDYILTTGISTFIIYIIMYVLVHNMYFVEGVATCAIIIIFRASDTYPFTRIFTHVANSCEENFLWAGDKFLRNSTES